MKSKKRRQENSGFTKVTAVAPILVSVISLVFGGWQYFDKGRLDSELQKKDLIIKEQEKHKLELENSQRELESFTRIEQFYIESSILEIKNAFSSGMRDKDAIQDEDFESAY